MHYNDVTGEALVTKPSSDKYRTGWDAIFGKKDDNKDEKPVVAQVDTPETPCSNTDK
jgi:hypothetical protein